MATEKLLPVSSSAQVKQRASSQWNLRESDAVCMPLTGPYSVSDDQQGHKLATGCHEYSITTYSWRPAQNAPSDTRNVISSNVAIQFSLATRHFTCMTRSALYVKWRSTVNWPQPRPSSTMLPSTQWSTYRRYASLCWLILTIVNNS